MKTQKTQKTQMLRLSLLALAGFFLANCSARDIVQEANPSLDPNPLTVDSTSLKSGVDPLAAQQWNLDRILAKGLTSNDGSKRIVVAVIGTGVDYTHEDLAGNIYINRNEWKSLTPGAQDSRDGTDDDGNGYVDDFIGYDFVENDGLPFDRNGAGTSIAGVLGAVSNNSKGITGLVPNVSILPIRCVDSSGHILIPNLFKALKYALDMKVDVVLLHTPSYEFGSSAGNPELRQTMADLERQMLKVSIRGLEKAGIPIVASAGNTGPFVGKSNSLMVELSTSSNVVVVTSVDKADTVPFVATFSGERVHTSAPGTEILTTIPGNKYGPVSSTSVAAAHVAGAIALAVDRQFGKKEVRRLVEAFVQPAASDTVEALKFKVIGGNRLNVPKYLKYLEGN